jgi:hypothetical protein
MSGVDLNTTGEGSSSNNPHRKGGDIFWNILTVLLLLGMVVMAGLFYLIFQNPTIVFNPYPPPTLPAPIVIPSRTPTVPKLPPTWTAVPTSTSTPVPTSVPRPTITAVPTATEIVADIPTSIPTAKINSIYAFVLQSTPTAIDASVLYPERDCKWLGVGGQVVDLQGRPVTGITVQLGGNLNNALLDQTSLTGLALKYGEAGYEFELAKLPIESKQTLWVRLIDQAKLPLSAKVYFDTYSECQRNLIVVNFRQVR